MSEIGSELPLDSLNGTFEIWGMMNVGPNGEPAVRIEILNAAKTELIGLTAVSDGAQFWLYDPGRNVVVVGQAEDMMAMLAQRMAEHESEFAGELPFDEEQRGQFEAEMADMPETPEEAVAKALEYFTAERNGSETIAGGDAYRLRLIPIPEQMPEEVRLAGGFVNVWLRSSDYLPLGVEYAESNFGYGKVVATTAEINAGLDNAIFTFAIPEGAEVVQATDLIAAMEAMKETAEGAGSAVDFEPLSPTDLPAGAVAEEGQQIAGAAVQRFNLADGTFVVAQGKGFPIDAPEDATNTETVQVRGVDGTLFTNDEGTRTLLTWQEGEMTFLIGGDLSPEQALAIAKSLQ
jgi:outer membrane lipoprotein-sorting protein